MKIREHRGSLDASMATVEEIDPTQEAVDTLVRTRLDLGRFELPDPLPATVVPYGHDARINWDTYLVYVPEHGVFGFTDGPLTPARAAYFATAENAWRLL